VVSDDIRLMPIISQYSSGFAGEVVSNKNAVVKNASFLFRPLYLQYEVPTVFTCRTLHGFARFPCDSMAFVLYYCTHYSSRLSVVPITSKLRFVHKNYGKFSVVICGM